MDVRSLDQQLSFGTLRNSEIQECSGKGNCNGWFSHSLPVLCNLRSCFCYVWSCPMVSAVCHSCVFVVERTPYLEMQNRSTDRTQLIWARLAGFMYFFNYLTSLF